MVRLARSCSRGSAANRVCLLRQRHTGKQKRVLVGICAIGLARWNVFVLRHRTIRKMGAVHVGTDLEYPVLPVSAGGLKWMSSGNTRSYSQQRSWQHEN